MRFTPNGTRGERLGLIVVLGSLSAFGPMSLDLYLPAFPQVAASFGVETGAIQFTFSASLLGLSLGQLLYGPMSDRYGRKRPLLFGLTLFIVASLACAVAPSLPLLVAFRFIQALGGCAGIVIARAIVRDCYSGTELASRLSAVSTVTLLAPILAPTVGTLVLTLGSWHWTFVVLALFGVACLVGALLVPETLPVERRNSHGFWDSMRGYRQVASNRTFQLAALLMGASSMMLFSYISSAPAVFIAGFGLSSTAFAFLFALNSLFLATGAQVNMRVARRVPTHRIIRVLVPIQAVGAVGVLIAALLGLPMVFTLIPLAMVMVCFSAVQANTLAEVLRPFAAVAGTAAALAGVTQMGMSALMTGTLSSLQGNARIEMGVGMVAAVSLGLILSAVLGRRLAAAPA